MSLLMKFTRHAHHPAIWFSMTLFYLLFFTGLWFQSWWIAGLALVGVLVELLLSPLPKKTPKWSDRIMHYMDEAWESMTVVKKSTVLAIGLGAVLLLAYACWHNMIWLTVIAVAILIVNKVLFLLLGYKADAIKQSQHTH